ncbi:MAG: NUDIX hydrolase [Rickettsiales bacterium]|jgi:8-oxo-dGTP pyrophosphatase MutT (NUDIX family)|nr:NUDIX hydrolase [Rickettsiales bacterium]
MTLISQIKNLKIIDSKQQSESDACLKFIEKYPDGDFYTRDNTIGHVCVSAWIVNKNRDKVLMVYHNIYDSFCWIGGHADGDKDLLHVAKKETEEEVGLNEKDLKVLNNAEPVDIVMQCCPPHEKRGKWIAPHLHLTVVYAFETDESLEIRKLESENSDVKWLDISNLNQIVKEEHMKHIYDRLTKLVNDLDE